MIVELTKGLLEIIFNIVIDGFDFPVIPSGLVNAFEILFTYMKMGLGFIDFFLPFENIMPIIDLVVLLRGVFEGYRVLMWVLRKIPLLNIE